uniref:Uncharacterized protein n=1 Tax=Cacopsylla melanoneura TaxID=428564 RepID=A0A8D9F6Z1_9HEMI
MLTLFRTVLVHGLLFLSHILMKNTKNMIGQQSDLRASFVPLVVSCDGAVGKEYAGFLKKTADKLSQKWSRSYGKILGWLRVQVQISIINAVSMRIRGTRKKIRGIGCEDGAGIFEVSE